jgi:hypothetical protein
MPSGPTLFDDGDGSGPDQPDRSGAETSEPRTDEHAADAVPGRRRSPNYLFRRAVVVGGIVAVLATASIVVGSLIGSGSNDSASGTIAAEWNRIVLVDDRTGRVIVDDADGEELERIESQVRTPTASAIVGSTLVVTGSESAAVIDIDSGTVEPFEMGADAIVRPSGSALTLVAPRPDGGRGLLVHGPSGDVIDTDASAQVVGARYEFADSRASASGRDVLVTDSGNFQSVLFSFDREEPSFFPGLALAVDADVVVTAQNVGADATINVFSHDGDPITSGRTASVRGGMLSEVGIVLVTVEGDIITMSSSSGEISDGAQLDLGTIESAQATTSGDRLVVVGATGTAIVDTGATVIAALDVQRPADGVRPASCVTTLTEGPEPQIAVVDATDGSVLVEATGTEPLLTDATTCIVATATPMGFDVLGRDGVQQFTNDDTLLALALDGRAVAAERDGRIVVILTGPDEPETEEVEPDTVDLGPRGRTVHFTQS